MARATTKTALLVLVTLIIHSSRSRADEPQRGKKGEDDVFPRAAAVELGIDQTALERLHKRAAEADSDAVVIVKNGRLVADWDFGQPRGPIEAMSATKSIVSLAIGRLIDSGKIKSLDQPVSDFYPEWKQGRKKLITIRHLLNQTSGLQNEPITTVEIYPSPDFVQLALAAELSDDPGSKFSYNNKAVNLLAGIVQRASGARLDRYLGKEIFEPLGIKDFHWTLDRAGNPHGMSGLEIRALDLARIGQMMLDEGSWKGKPVLSKEWINKSVEPSQSLDPTYGLLWWLLRGPTRFAVDDGVIKHFKDRGMTAESAAKMEALKGKSLETEVFWASLRPIIRQDKVLKTKLLALNRDLPHLKPIVDGPSHGYEAQGYLGQFLVVIPRDRIVAVRQRRFRSGSAHEGAKLNFMEFPEMVASLVAKPPAKP
jgi:CubicO group peptidase (beta-lactamase class C family)